MGLVQGLGTSEALGPGTEAMGLMSAWTFVDTAGERVPGILPTLSALTQCHGLSPPWFLITHKLAFSEPK